MFRNLSNSLHILFCKISNLAHMHRYEACKYMCGCISRFKQYVREPGGISRYCTHETFTIRYSSVATGGEPCQ